MLRELEFDIQFETANNFLDRYQQLFFLDQEKAAQKSQVKEVLSMSRYLCRYSLRSVDFLDYLPSQIAAASLMIALNSVKDCSETDFS